MSPLERILMTYRRRGGGGCSAGPVWASNSIASHKANTGMIYDSFLGLYLLSIVAPSGAAPGTIYWSSDGQNWNSPTTAPAFDNGFSPIVIASDGLGKLYAGANQSNLDFKSTDGKNWATNTGTPNTSRSTGAYQSAWFGNGILIALRADSNALVSTVGDSPSTNTLPFAGSGGLYIADTLNKHLYFPSASNTVYESATAANSASWSLRGTTTFGVSDGIRKIVVGASGQLVALSDQQKNFVSYSTDYGATWSSSTGLPGSSVAYQDCIYAQGAFLLSDANGTCYSSVNGGASWSLNASSLQSMPAGGANIQWTMASDGLGNYAAATIQTTPQTTAAHGTC